MQAREDRPATVAAAPVWPGRDVGSAASAPQTAVFCCSRCAAALQPLPAASLSLCLQERKDPSTAGRTPANQPETSNFHLTTVAVYCPTPSANSAINSLQSRGRAGPPFSQQLTQLVFSTFSFQRHDLTVEKPGWIAEKQDGVEAERLGKGHRKGGEREAEAGPEDEGAKARKEEEVKRGEEVGVEEGAEVWKEGEVEAMVGGGKAEAKSEEEAEVQEDIEVGVERGGAEVGQKLKGILRHKIEDLVASLHHHDRKNGMSRKEEFTKGRTQENREGRNGKEIMMTEKGRIEEMGKVIDMNLNDGSP